MSTIWDEKKVRKLVRELRRLATPQHDETAQFDIYLDLKHISKENPAPYNFNGPQLLFETNRIAEVIEDSNADNTKKTSNTLITPYRISKESDYHLQGSFDADGKFTGTFTIVRGDNLPIPLNLDAPPLDRC